MVARVSSREGLGSICADLLQLWARERRGTLAQPSWVSRPIQRRSAPCSPATDSSPPAWGYAREGLSGRRHFRRARNGRTLCSRSCTRNCCSPRQRSAPACSSALAVRLMSVCASFRDHLLSVQETPSASSGHPPASLRACPGDWHVARRSSNGTASRFGSASTSSGQRDTKESSRTCTRCSKTKRSMRSSAQPAVPTRISCSTGSTTISLRLAQRSFAATQTSPPFRPRSLRGRVL